MRSSPSRHQTRDAPTPAPPPPVRYQPPKVKPAGENGGAVRTKTPLVQEQVVEEEEVEEEEEEEVEEVEHVECCVEEKLQSIGVCPASYKWNRGFYTQSCGKCGKPVNNGYRCAGGSHYVCLLCVNSA